MILSLWKTSGPSMACGRGDGVDAMACRLHAVDAAVRENRSTQAMKSMFYEEPIDTRWILHRLLRTADALIDNWSFHYGILEETDRERCYRDAMPVKALPSTEMNAAEELRIGGETVYKTVDFIKTEAFNRTRQKVEEYKYNIKQDK